MYHRVAEGDDVVKTFPTLVDILVDGGVGAEVPLPLGGIGVVHVAREHVELPLEVVGELVPGDCGVEGHRVGAHTLVGCVEVVLGQLVDRVDGQEVVAGRQRPAERGC